MHHPSTTPLVLSRQRPLGITVLAILYWLTAIGGLVVAIVISMQSIHTQALLETVLALLLGVGVPLIVCLLVAAIGRGLWQLRLAACQAAIALHTLVGVGILFSFAANSTLPATRLIALVAHISIILYLLRPSVRAAFQ